MGTDTIWDPDQMESSGFVPGEELIQEGETYTVTNAVFGDNQFDSTQKELRLTVDGPGVPENAEGIMLRLRYSNRQGSKFHTWLKSLKDSGLEIGSPDEFIGIQFVAGKTVKTGRFRDRDDPTKFVERVVTTVFAASVIDGTAPAAVEAAAEDPELIDLLLEIADGQKFSAILTAAANEEKLMPLRKQISNKSILNDLITSGKLALEGAVYKRVE